MSDTSLQDFFTRQAAEARGPESPRRLARRKRQRTLRRLLLASGIGMAVLIGAVVGTGYLYVSNLAGKVHRISVPALDAKHQPAWAQNGSETILLTDTQAVPGQFTDTGLIELLHLNGVTKGETSRTGAVISIPADAVVPVPNVGQLEIGQTLAVGGPSLMVETIEQLTGIRIDHYSAIDFASLPQVISALGGVQVQVPFTVTADGFVFPAGTDTLNSADALAYVRQADVSEIGREELQENLLRVILDKIAADHDFVATDVSVLNAVVNAVSVDSDLSNSQLTSLALSLGALQSGDGTFVDAPVQNGSPITGDDQPVHLNVTLSQQLWQAINNGLVAQFAQQNPSTVTPGAPG
jgi:LCP family protein required for cell wall assembly